MKATILQFVKSTFYFFFLQLINKIPVILAIILFTLSLSHAQVNREWVKNYNDTLNTNNNYSSIDLLKVMTVDYDNNVYVSGICFYNTYEFKMVTVKYNSSGNIVWKTAYPQNYSYVYSQPTDIKVDVSGNVYISSLYRTGSYSDYAVFKFDANGQLLWHKIYNGNADYIDTPFGITVDFYKNVYVTGKSFKTSNYDIVTIKYNSAGVQQWIAYYDSPGHMDDVPVSISQNVKGDILIGGSSGTLNNESDFCFIKYDPAGSQKWSYIYDNNGWYDEFKSMVLDLPGNIYAAGSTSQGIEDTRFCTIKIDSSGILKWSKTFTRGNGYLINEPKGIGLDENKNVYVAGITEKDYTNIDFLTLKYNSEGTEQWYRYYNNNFVYTAMVSGLEVDNFGNSYITGFAVENDYGYTTIKYDKNGNLKWHARYEQAGSETDNFPLIAKWDDDIYISGVNNIYNSGPDYLLIKYHQSPDTVIFDPVIPAAFELKQNFPNPFNPSTSFSFDLPEPSKVTINVYNIQGKIVGTVIDRYFDAGKIQIKWNAFNLPSGIYFYQIIAGKFIDSKKMILCK